VTPYLQRLHVRDLACSQPLGQFPQLVTKPLRISRYLLLVPACHAGAQQVCMTASTHSKET
jgi:hypothetical protein